MNENRLIPNSSSAGSRREEVWSGVYQLLHKIRFTHERGGYARSDRLCVLIDTQPGDDSDTFDADILIFPLGEEQVDVKGLPVTVLGYVGEYRALRRGATNARGFVTFGGLPQGTYRLVGPKGVIAATEPVRFPTALAAANAPRSPLLEEYRSEDDSLTCTLYETSARELVLSFDVVSQEGEGARVDYALVEEPSGQIAAVEVRGERRLLAGQAPLTREVEGQYRARVSLGYPLGLPPRYYLRAYLVLPGDAEHESDTPVC